MSIEQAIADNTAALKAQTAAIIALSEVMAGARTVGVSENAAAATKTTTTSKTTSTKPEPEEVETIYWCVPNTEHFGTVASEAEYKKIKKAHPKAIKTIESKYNALVEAASQAGGDDEEVNERVQGLIDAVPESPEEADIIALFTGYLTKDLSKDERDARVEILKPILAGVKAAKATAVKDEDRYDVMVAVIKGIEAHLEETGQVSEEDEMV